MHKVLFELNKAEQLRADVEITIAAGEAQGREDVIDIARQSIVYTDEAAAKFRAASSDGKNTEAADSFYKNGVILFTRAKILLDEANAKFGGEK